MYACSAVIAFFALFLLFLKGKKLLHLHMFVAFSCLSYILFYFAGSRTEFLAPVFILRYSDLSVTYIAAPAIYLVFMSLFSEGKRDDGSDFLFYLVPSLVTCFFVVSNLAHLSLADLVIGYPLPFSISLLSFLDFFADFFFTFYFGLSVFQAWRIHSRNEVTQPREFRIILLFLILLLLNSLFMLSGHFADNDTIYNISSVLYAFVVILFGLVSPQISQYVLGISPKIIVEKNLLSPEELTSLRARLDFLMGTKKLFRDPELNLKSLAKEANVNPHQLSWFINSELGLGFSIYINRFRLDSVGKELLINSDGNILEIAMANGFGSKTTFNSLFLNMYGVSPRDYRRINGNEHKAK